MENEKCELRHSNNVKEKKLEVIDGYTIKYHANGKTIWSKGKMIGDQPDGYWEWYRADGTIKRSGYFQNDNPVDMNGLPMIAKVKNTKPPIVIKDKIIG